MSDEEIRDLLDLGVEEPDSDGLSTEQLWSAGRRQRNRGRAWLGGLGAAAAAAGILGIVWAQGLAGGDAAPPPPADTTPGPTEAADPGSRGEPYLAMFHRAETEPPAQLSGTSTPATLEDLQGTWHGPDGERLVVEEDQVILTITNCESARSSGTVSVDGQLSASEWSFSTADGPDCEQWDAAMTNWPSALMQSPLLSLDGETLLVTGLDGTSDEPRVHVALTLGLVDDFGGTWADVPARTGITPIALGRDFALLTGGGGDGTRLDSVHELLLEDRPGAAQSAQGYEIELIGDPGTCPLEMQSSLRSDDVLLVGAPAQFSACAEGSDSYLPPAEPSPAAVALLRSGPTVGFDDGTMLISGTIPESLLEQPTPPVDATPTSEPPDDGSADPTEGETGTETPANRDDIPLVVGTPTVVVMSEGGWAPTGELTPLTDATAVNRHWLMVQVIDDSGVVDQPWSDYGLTFDGSAVHVRECSVDVSVPGHLRDGVFVATGEPQWVDDPDPGSDCPVPVYTDEWVQILTSEPRMSTDGEILVIAGGADDTQLGPVGLALLADGVDDPQGGPTAPVTLDDLAAGLVEVRGDVAVQDVGVSDVRDLQPEHTARLSLEDGVVTVDVGCAEPLRGPAWFSQVGPDDADWRLTAVLPAEPDCTGAGAADAELWRQMLAHGAFLHHFGDYVILDGWADPALAPGAGF
ncbi:hypothetical protein [Ornithinimicrobium cryptoxanthini]|uniref:hypothetical protein n=1 Tax=Ornithinimicrobium cryptoxanthini TaxID=2934161 RepID=UPI00211796FC|nr:hypothetical protein [Ornithinimicrobium cryptoxanthini]